MADTNKKYLIQFLATIQGDKMVVESLKTIEKTTEEVNNKGGRHLKSFGERFAEMARHSLLVIPIWATLRSVYMGFINLITGTFQFLVDWEVQMAQIAMVGKLSGEQIDVLSGQLLRLAAAYGVSSQEMGEVAAMWVAQGRAFQEIMPLMEATTRLSLLSGTTMKQSVENLTAIMKNYGIESENVTAIIDALNKVEDNHAISMKVLVDGLKAVGPMAKEIGVDFAQMAGIITATHEVTKAKGEAIGVSWKTIFTRIATGAGEAITQISGVPVYLNEAGEASNKQTANFRNLGDVLDELAMKWNNLSKAQQFAVAEKVAGKRQATPFIGYMENFQEGVKAQAQALFSAGEGMNDVGIITDTLKNRITGLTETWKVFASTIGDTDFVKAPIWGLEKVLQGITFAVNPAQGAFADFTKQIKELENETDKQLGIQNGLLGSWSQMSRYNEIFKNNPELAKQWSGYLAEVYGSQMKLMGLSVPTWITDTNDMFKWLNDSLPEIQKKMLDLMTEKQEITLKKELAATGLEVKKLLGLLGNAPAEVEADLETLTFKAMLTSDDVDRVKEYFSQWRPDKLEAASKILDSYKEKEKGLTDITNIRLKAAERLAAMEKDRQTTVNMVGAEQAAEALRQIEIKAVAEQKDELEILKEKKAYLEEHNILYTDQLEKQKETLETSLARKEAEQNVTRALKDESVLLAQMKVNGASDLQIEIQRLAFMEQRKVGEEKIYEQRKKLQLLVLQTLDQEKEKMTDLYLQYEKADELERSRLRRMMELRQMSPEDLAKQYETNAYDAKLIEQYWSNFSKEGQRAVGELIRKKYNLPEAKLPGGIEEVPDRITESFAPKVAEDFWDAWTARAKNALDFFKGQWESIVNGTSPNLGQNTKGEKSKEVVSAEPTGEAYMKYNKNGKVVERSNKLDVTVKVDVGLDVDEDAKEKIAETTKKEVKKAIDKLNSEDIKF